MCSELRRVSHGRDARDSFKWRNWPIVPCKMLVARTRSLGNRLDLAQSLLHSQRSPLTAVLSEGSCGFLPRKRMSKSLPIPTGQKKRVLDHASLMLLLPPILLPQSQLQPVLELKQARRERWIQAQQRAVELDLAASPTEAAIITPHFSSTHESLCQVVDDRRPFPRPSPFPLLSCLPLKREE